MGRPIVNDKPQTPNARRLVVLGHTIFGENWQNTAARALGKTPCQISRYVRQGADPSDELIEELKQIGRQRAAEIMKASKG